MIISLAGNLEQVRISPAIKTPWAPPTCDFQEQEELGRKSPQKRCGSAPIELFALPVSGEPIRIISDVHYGDRASQVSDLIQLRPLFEGIGHLVLNGDALDTRAGPRPDHTATCRAEWQALVQASPAPITFLTGNHDPDVSEYHWLDLGAGKVFVVHGDVLFDDIVPWGRDARTIRNRIVRELGPVAWPARVRLDLGEQARLWRQVAGSIPQRHQSERRPFRYALRFAVDTIWPPTRIFRIVSAWRSEAARAVELARYHRPNARFIVLGHTHRPNIRRTPEGPIVINTGSFTAPFGGYAVDVLSDRVRIRRVVRRARAFHPGPIVAELPLTG